MEKMIRWLMEIENLSGEVYAESADLLAEDRPFAEFLNRLAKDEKMHHHLMGSAMTCFKANPQIRNPVAVDQLFRESIEAPFRKVLDLMAEGRFTKSSIIRCIVEAEHSEWNDLFLFVVNTLKHHCREFVRIGPVFQHHLRFIEGQMETLDEGRELIHGIRNLQPVWRERLLLVDDDETLRDLLSSILGKFGGIDTAADGREALGMARDRYYAVILSDIDMPEMNGVEFYEQLKNRYPDVGRRFVFLTGNSGEDIETYMSENDLRLLTKPASLTVIRQAVYDIMARNSSAQVVPERMDLRR